MTFSDLSKHNQDVAPIRSDLLIEWKRLILLITQKLANEAAESQIVIERIITEITKERLMTRM